MDSNGSAPSPDNTPTTRLFSGVRLIVTVCLLVVLVLCLAFAWGTRGVMAHLPFLRTQHAGSISTTSNTLVDLRPWQTAQVLAALAVTSEEINYAREAERLADHEVDQAFASALRQASVRQHTLTGDALALSKKVAGLQQVVKDDQERVRVLTPPAGSASATSAAPPPANSQASTGSFADDLDVAKAQLGLDSDELADAQQDLARASGDQRPRIEQELAAHQAIMRKNDANPSERGQIAAVSTRRYGTVAGRLGAWFDQRTRLQLIEQAAQQTRDDLASLTRQHNALEKSANSNSGNAPGSVVPLDKSAKLASLKQLAAQRQILSIYDDRIQTGQQIESVYGKWINQVQLQHGIMEHLLLGSFALLAFIVLCVISLDAIVRHLVARPSLDRRRMLTLKTILELGIQVIGVLVLLLVIFGPPSQMPTIIGLATAGITVVLQDFIIAFFGWFVLMGKNGIRVGDWVEINGVGGEIVEIGVFRTAMLETGNWTGKGHPTGRRVTFTNSFAITGQYFNFSTAGQWMWDEIRVSIPATQDTSKLMEQLESAVAKETEKDAELADAEWKRATGQNGLSQFQATPSVNLRPGAAGMDLIVRYVTRASERFEVRNRVYERVIELTHKPVEIAAAPPEQVKA